jgi:CheY-like chemotaxis protein
MPHGYKQGQLRNVRSSLTLRILLAEDEQSIKEVCEIVLKDAGHDVSSVNDGEECIQLYSAEKAKGSNFDLLIVDYHMPRKDGAEVIKEVLGQNPDQKIMMLTAFSKDVTSQTIPMDKVKVLFKPIELDDFLREVKSFQN